MERGREGAGIAASECVSARVKKLHHKCLQAIYQFFLLLPAKVTAPRYTGRELWRIHTRTTSTYSPGATPPRIG